MKIVAIAAGAAILGIGILVAHPTAKPVTVQAQVKVAPISPSDIPVTASTLPIEVFNAM